MMSRIVQDVRYAVRLLRRNPAVSAMVIGMLALGIGANTAAFTLLNAVLLDPLPVDDVDRLVSLFTVDRHNPGHYPTATLNFRDVRDDNDVFSGMAAIGLGQFVLSLPGEEPDRVNAQPVTANYFDVLGVSIRQGRGFHGAEDDPPGAHRVCVLSDAYWVRRFGRDPRAVGSTVLINNQPFTVIGIAPPGFRGTFSLAAADLWLPLSMYDTVLPGTPLMNSRRWRWLTIVARLKPGISVERAQASMATLAGRLERAYSEENAGRTVALVPLARALINPGQRGHFVEAGVVLVVVVVLVLLIVCANVANLLLARGIARQREVGIRLSLGAGRRRILQQAMTEHVVLAMLGGAVGVGLAQVFTSSAWLLRPDSFGPLGFELSVDSRALVLSGILSTASAFVFGTAPAAYAARVELTELLRTGGRTTTVPATRLRGALASAGVAFSVIALVVAGLFVRSLQAAQAIDPLFESERLITADVNLTVAGHGEDRGREWMRQTLERVARVPNVVSATWTDRLPLTLSTAYTLRFEGQPMPPGGLGYTIGVATVGPRYFDTMGIPILRGRGFDPAIDKPGATAVAIVNDSMAQRFWPGDDPIGKRFAALVRPGWIQVIGVARDSRYVTLGEPPTPFFYLPLEQEYRGALWLVVKSAADPAALENVLRRELRFLDRSVVVGRTQSIAIVLDQALWAPRFAAGLLTAVGIVALVLATLGVYGIVAYLISQRRHELAVRLALGAPSRHIERLIVAQGLLVTAAGVLPGLIVAWLMSRALSNLLYAISSSDPVTFTAVAALLCSSSLAACYLPARRSTKLDPNLVLRGE